MGRYTYTLNQKREEPSMNFYRRTDLEKMTLSMNFRLWRT